MESAFNVPQTPPPGETREGFDRRGPGSIMESQIRLDGLWAKLHRRPSGYAGPTGGTGDRPTSLRVPSSACLVSSRSITLNAGSPPSQASPPSAPVFTTGPPSYHRAYIYLSRTLTAPTTTYHRRPRVAIPPSLTKACRAPRRCSKHGGW